MLNNRFKPIRAAMALKALSKCWRFWDIDRKYRVHDTRKYNFLKPIL